ncbi:MAG TPA: ammonium transporter [Candidatus Eisenbacteria bacterium]|nr:ammonium transporter [Candidatus Eisenbacteria bacterium]
MRRIIPLAVLILVIGFLFGLLSKYFAGASAGASTISAINTGDTAWVLISTALVMLMTPAVGFFYGGMVQKKNVVSILKQSFVILAIVSLQWVLFGYSLVFGKDIMGIIGGFTFFGLRDVGFSPNPVYAATIPHLAFMMFQAMFAIVTPALIIGAVAGRISFKSLIIFTLLWTTFIYDPIAHWVWGIGGWLHTLGALDFAGGTVVHISAGFAGIVAAMMVGKRSEKTNGDQYAHNVPFVLLGAALLWFGWFGFNAGSALSASGLAWNAFVTTNTAAAAAGLVWMILSWKEHRRPSAMATATGAVCGLVAITPASGFVGPIASIAIGVIAGVVTYLALVFRTKKIPVDDTLDVWAAHGIGGVTGALLTGIFAEKVINSAGNNGLLFGNPYQLVIQIIAVVSTASFAFVGTWILLKAMSIFMKLRVSKAEELAGLDKSSHGEEGYVLS